MTIFACRPGAFSIALAAGLVAAMPAAAQSGPRGPELIAFDGVRELVAASQRVGMLSQQLEFTIEVGPDGAPTGCDLARKFRSPRVKKELCEVLMRRSRFHPARDAQGTAVNGTYIGNIDFRMWVDPDR